MRQLSTTHAGAMVVPHRSDTRSTGAIEFIVPPSTRIKGSFVIRHQDWSEDLGILHFSSSTAVDMLQRTLEENRFYRQRLETLERQMSEVLAERAESEAQVRKVSKAVGRRKVEAYFKKHRDQTIYPSDVADALGLSYDFVVGMIEDLAQQGRIAKAD